MHPQLSEDLRPECASLIRALRQCHEEVVVSEGAEVGILSQDLTVGIASTASRLVSTQLVVIWPQLWFGLTVSDVACLAVSIRRCGYYSPCNILSSYV
eukprot:gene6330-9258_t